jgi:hypothetical protein
MENEAGFYLTGQVIAAYLQVRLWPTHQLVGVARSRSLFVATPLSGCRVPPQTGFRKVQLSSACLREAASAEAGAFLIRLKNMIFSKGFLGKADKFRLRWDESIFFILMEICVCL